MKKGNYLYFSSLLILVLSITRLSAQTSISQAQAVFLFNFTKMVEWPLDYKSGDFVIGVCGTSEVTESLKYYTKGKTVGQQNIKIVQFANGERTGKCHILFVCFPNTKELTTIINRISGNKTLIVCEKTGALSNGAAINFVVLEDKLKFELKQQNAIKFGLKILSSLQNMAISK